MYHSSDSVVARTTKETCWSWVMVTACGFLQAFSYSAPVTMGAFFQDWVTVYDVDRTVASIPLSVNVGMLYILVPVSNQLAERVSYRLTIMLGSVIATAGLFASTYASSIPWLIASYGVCTGIGYCLMFGPAMTAIPLIFDSYVNVAAGLASMIAGLASTLLPYVFECWIHSFGWKVAMLFLAFMVLQGTVMGALIFPSEMRQKRKMKQTMSDRKLCQDLFSFRTVCLYAATSLGSISLLTFSLLAPDQASSLGLSYKQGSMVVSITGFGSLFGRMLVAVTGRLTRGRSLVLVTLALASRASVMLIPLLSSFWHLVAVGLVMGLGWGVHASLLATSTAETFGLRLLPQIIGVIFVVVGMSSYVALPLAGWVYSLNNSYNMVWCVMGAVSGLAALLLLPLLCKRTPCLQNAQTVNA